MEDHEARQLVGPTIKALEHAWDRGDGAAFAAKCTADVDFINLLGMHVKGRQAVAATHEKIFRGPYAASTLKFGLEHVRPLSNDGVLAIVSGELKIPGGEVKGFMRTVATILFVRHEDEWQVASFQNTKREATNPDHTAIMAGVFTADERRA